ncbi:MAG: Ig-like domain-containing protein [Cypionkella sp.]|nr:Ig-like domain-containing protein [Cypionkella sp.]
MTVAEDSGATSGSVLTGTTSADGTVTVSSFQVAGNATVFTAGQTATMAGVGTLVINANGSYTFTPAANYNGSVPVVTYSMTDGTNTDTSTLSITVSPVADAFSDANETVTVAEDSGATSGSVLTGTTSADGTVTVSSFQVAGNATVFTAGQTATMAGVGTLVINANGSYTFTPAANYNGSVPVVTYSMTDGTNTDTSTLSITVSPVADAFSDANETVTVAEDSGATSGSVLTGTTSADGTVTVSSFQVAGNATVFTAGQTATMAGVGTLVINANGSYTFTPAANYNGSVPVVTYSMTDGTNTDTSTLSITVSPVADAFSDANETVTVAEDSGATSGSVLTGTTSADGTVTVSSFQVAGNATVFTAGQTATMAGVGTLVINANGSYTFTPAANYNGSVPVVTYSMTDGTNTDTSTLSITVSPVADAFSDANETVTVAEDSGATSGSVLTGTTSADGTVTVSSFQVAGNATVFTAGQTATMAGVGTLVINANGSYTFTPAANYNGSVPVVTYSMTDGTNTDTSTLSITVSPVADAFSDANETVTVAEDSGATSGSVLTGTTSADGTVTVSSFQVAGNATVFTAGQTATMAGVGTLVINANGSYTFTPAANYNGSVPVVTYSMTDGTNTDTSTLSITVSPVTDAFSDANETVTVAEDSGATSGSVLTGTTSADGSVTVSSFQVAGNATVFTAGQTATMAGVGTLVINANGSYTFTPAANYNGSVPVVTYSMTDGTNTDTSTLSITVSPVTDAFSDANETVTVAEDSGATSGSVLTGTTSADGTVTVSSFQVAGNATVFTAGQTATMAGVGTLVINANGSYTFTPAANYNGSVPVVTYSMTDGTNTDTSTLSITVSPVTDPFSDANETVTVAEDSGATSGSVLTGTTSADGTVTVSSFQVAGNATVFTAGQTATMAGVGTLVINANGSYTFTPAANYNGSVPVVTYSMTDGTNTDTSTLSITVSPVADAFSDANETVTVAEDSGATSGSVLTGTTSADGTVTVSSFQVAGNATVFTAGQTATMAGVGTLVINANGSYTFTPAANYNGSVPVVTYSMTDGTNTDTSTLSITVTPVNDPFTDANETVTVAEDSGATSGSVLTGTTSADGTVTVSSFQVAGNATVFTAGQTATMAGVGTLVINANGSYTFTPAANYNGSVPLVTYSMTDGTNTDTSTLSITVSPVNDVPTIGAGVGVSSGSVVEAGGVANAIAGAPTTSGTLTIVDADSNQSSFQAIPPASLAGTYGSFTFNNATGAWTYALDNTKATTQGLTAGQVVHDTLTVTSLDGTASRAIDVTVTGANDNATITGTATASMTEDVAVSAGNLITSGALAVSDVDTGQTLFQTPATLAGTYGTFTFNTATGAWTYSASNAQTAVQALGVGQSLTDSISVKSLDGTATQAITVTINGTNDVPTVISGAVTGTEDTALTLTWANFGISDIDSTASTLSVKIITLPADGILQYSANGTTWSNVTSNQLITKADVDAGRLRFTPDSNESGSNEYLSAGTGNMKNDYAQITYQGSDGSLTSTTATLTVDIKPVADDPILKIDGTSVIDGSTTIVSQPPGNGLTVRTYTAIPNIDSNAVNTLAEVRQLLTLLNANTPATTSISTAPQNYTANTDGAPSGVPTDGAYRMTGVIYLEAGHTYTFSSYMDDTALLVLGGDIVLEKQYNSWGNITGTTYAPAASGYFTLDWAVYNGHSIGALKPYLSVDGGAAQDLTSNNFKIYSSIAAVESAGGAHDAVVGTSTAGYYPVSNSGVEDAVIKISPITISLADTDGSEALVSLIAKNLLVGTVLSDGTNSFTATAGTPSVNITGWSLSTLTMKAPANFSGTYGLTLELTSKENATNELATTTTTLSIPIAAVNDVPVAVADTNGVAENSGTYTVSGSVSSNDTDIDGDTLTVSAVSGQSALTGTSVAGSYGTFVINANGTYTYTLTSDDARVNALNTGQTLTDAIAYTIADPTGASSSSTLTITINGTTDTYTGTSLIIGTNSANTLTGTSTNDNINARGGNDYVEAGSGNDVVYAGDSSTLTTTVANLAGSTFMTTADGSMTTGGVLTTAVASTTNKGYGDLVHGGAGNDALFGENGSDLLYGGTGNDYLHGGTSNDALRGGVGNDRLEGGQGSDVLRGDSGADVFVWSLNDGNSTNGVIAAGAGNPYGVGNAIGLSGTTDLVMDFSKIRRRCTRLTSYCWRKITSSYQAICRITYTLRHPMAIQWCTLAPREALQAALTTQQTKTRPSC